MIFEAIGELIEKLWQADSQVRDGGAFDESEKSRRQRRIIAVVCGVLLASCALLGIVFGL